MKCAMYIAVLVTLVASPLQAALKLPPYLKSCSKSDPNFSVCALKNGIAAIPFLVKGDAKYHIPVLDPLHLEHVDIAQGTGPVKINLILDDVNVRGLKEAELKAVSFDEQKKEISIELFVKGQALSVDSKYKIDGQVLVLPIKGNGDVNLKVDNVGATFKCGYNLVNGEDGKEYIKIKDSSLDFTLTKAVFDFRNLFNGNKALAPYLEPCSKSDPNFKACALKNGIAAIPSLVKGDAKYHIPALDPLHLQHVDIDQGTGPVKISLDLDNVDIRGLKDAELKAFSFDEKKKEIGVELFVKGQPLSVNSKYKIDGQVLILPIKGNGDMSLKMENVGGIFKCGYDLVMGEDGKEYIKIKDSSLEFTLTKAVFDFKNLFNGDKTLGDNMNVFLNENWQDVFSEVKPVLAETIRIVIANILDEVVTTVPYEDIFPA